MQKIKQAFQRYFQKFYRQATGAEAKEPRFLFYFFSWTFAFLFFSFSVLAGKNPFSLLLPFTLFDLPRLDSRENVTIYLSDGISQQVPIERKIGKGEDSIGLVYRIAREMGNPPYSNAKISIQPKKLLDLDMSLISVWFRSEETELILHWKKASIEKSMKSYRLPRFQTNEVADEDGLEKENYYSPPELQAQESEESRVIRRNQVLVASFKALDASLFANFPKIKTIRHLLDGKSSAWDPGLEYDFSSPKARD